VLPLPVNESWICPVPTTPFPTAWTTTSDPAVGAESNVNEEPLRVYEFLFWYTPSINTIKWSSSTGDADNVNAVWFEVDVYKSVWKGFKYAALLIVTESALASVVNVIPWPATKVNESFSCSATTFDWPETEIVPNESPPPPILPHAPSAYPSNSEVVVLYLNCPKAAVGLWPVVPFGTLNASVSEPISKLTAGEFVPIPTVPPLYHYL